MTTPTNDAPVTVEQWRQREVQALGAALSCRDWHMMETAYNALRDKMDRWLIEQRRLAALASAPGGDGVEEAFRQALEDVCNPLGYLQRKAEADGARLGGMAYAIANDIATVQGIARDALAAALARPRAAVGEREARLEAALRRAAVNLTLTPRHNRHGEADKHIEAARDEIRLALQSPPAKVEG